MKPTTTQEAAITADKQRKIEKNGQGRYSHEPKEDIGDNVKKTVHEYLTPRKQTGYQVVYETVKDGKTYTKSEGHGPQADARTWDWTEKVEDEV